MRSLSIGYVSDGNEGCSTFSLLRGDGLVGDFTVGLTMLALMMVEIGVKFPARGDFVEISMGGMVWRARER
jgi:hypothetical protein